MDPFSIATGVVGLADTGTSLASLLMDKYRSYRDAPELICEIAQEVEFSSSLIDLFGANLDKSGRRYPARFQQDARTLVARTNVVFAEIRKLVPEDRGLDKGARARWNFVLDKKKLAGHQQKLRQLQQMFMFMETMLRDHYTSDNVAISTNASVQNKNNSFNGILKQDIPIQISGVGQDGRATSFQATLTLNPLVQLPEPGYQPSAPAYSPSASEYAAPVSASNPYSDEVPVIESRFSPAVKGRRRLEGMRKSPLFDKSLFGDIAMRSSFPSTPYSAIIDVEPIAKERTQNDKAKERKKASKRVSFDDEMPNDNPRFLGDAEASLDIESFAERWFGASADADVQPVDEVVTIEESESQTANAAPSPPILPISRRPNNPLNDTHAYATPKLSTQKPRQPLPSGNGRNEGQNLAPVTVTCDGCNRRAYNDRFKCMRCDNFDFCYDCYSDPEKTVRHRHPKRDFQHLKFTTA